MPARAPKGCVAQDEGLLGLISGYRVRSRATDTQQAKAERVGGVQPRSYAMLLGLLQPSQLAFLSAPPLHPLRPPHKSIKPPLSRSTEDLNFPSQLPTPCALTLGAQQRESRAQGEVEKAF